LRGKYFQKKILKKDRMLITILRNETNNKIFKFLIKYSKNNEMFSANELTKKMEKSRSTISVSLKILQKNNVVERVIMNKNVKLTNDLGYKIKGRKLWNSYIIKYNL